uniref:Sugar phosphate transporter domain-containing protein n=6 Tax=Triticinae TaxID=1648030 RepID=A0A452ZES2_AEGTS
SRSPRGQRAQSSPSTHPLTSPKPPATLTHPHRQPPAVSPTPNPQIRLRSPEPKSTPPSPPRRARTHPATTHPDPDPRGGGAGQQEGAMAGGGGAGGLSESVMRKVLLSYCYVAVWIFLSFAVIVYNKYILDPKMYNWPFPISLTMVHMSFCSSLAVGLVRVLRVVEPPSSPPMTPQLYTSSVVPIGALYAMSLWFSNSAYIYLSVSFIQMLKALMPVAVYSIGVLFKKETFRSSSMLNMLSISFGVAIAAYGEARFDLRGVALQLAAVAFEATRLVLIQILLTSKGISLNPITSLYYVAPCCLCFLLVPWIFVELPRLRAVGTFQPDFFIFGTNSLCAFALNLAVFLLVGKTSALTMNVAGVVKDWLLIAFSWSVIRDTVTPINLFGYGIAFLGVGYYNHIKLQALKAKEAQKKSAQADEEAGSLLQERDSHSDRKSENQA